MQNAMQNCAKKVQIKKGSVKRFPFLSENFAVLLRFLSNGCGDKVQRQIRSTFAKTFVTSRVTASDGAVQPVESLSRGEIVKLFLYVEGTCGIVQHEAEIFLSRRVIDKTCIALCNEVGYRYRVICQGMKFPAHFQCVHVTVIFASSVEGYCAVDVLLTVVVLHKFFRLFQRGVVTADKFGKIQVEPYPLGDFRVASFQQGVAVYRVHLFPVVETHVAFQVQCRRVTCACNSAPIQFGTESVIAVVIVAVQTQPAKHTFQSHGKQPRIAEGAVFKRYVRQNVIVVEVVVGGIVGV